MIDAKLLEYVMTIGIIVSFVGTILFAMKSRKYFGHELKRLKFSKKDLVIVLVILLIFILFEQIVVTATQQLFFDDAIYQGMALDLLHTGQAWMCNFGSPIQCFSGEVYHEPIGESFNLAIGFLILGLHRASSYMVEFILSAIAVLLSFFVSLFLFNDKKIAFFSELLVALSPILLVWAKPTTSDIPMLTYSLLAIFAMLLFSKRKNIWTFGFTLFSISLLTYMKVDAIIYIPLILFMYIILDDRNIKRSIINNLKRIRKNILNTKILLILLIVLIAITPELTYTAYENLNGNYGANNTTIQNTCGKIGAIIHAYKSFGLQYFGANLCANISFWFNGLKKSQVIQPAIFTFLGIIGVALAIIYKKYRRRALALGVWFLTFFIIYTTFYAGGANYGVDWRFMLSIIIPVGIFGGITLSKILGLFVYAGKRLKKKKLITAIGIIAILLLVSYPIYELLPILGITPSNIQQAGNARFYENLVYNSSYKIPSSCLVYSYDPTLFNINNLTSTQFGNINSRNIYKKNYSCGVIDIGYWCSTPNSSCGSIMNSIKTEVIVNATYPPTGFTYGFYRIV